jgi:4-methyl-5(b-hydroxyethyl)-thiazole monophosphate biosynthesis
MHGAIITGEAATETGNIITGRSMGCAIPFALRIIAHYLGEEKADQTAASVVYSGPRI